LDIQIKGAQGNDHKCAVLLIDMDRFKYVNDTLGHPVGDVLLKQLSKRMESVMRSGQSSYRLGGDEFAVVLTHVDSYFDAVSTAEHIMELVKEPFLIDGYELNITVSIGISQSGNETTTVENLFRNADTALFYAKTQGRDQVQCYTRSLDAQSYKRFTLSNDLRKALVKDELFLEYMPRVQTLTTEIVAVEALIRWKHPEWGIISPAEFIPIAEETGLIVSIGEWVLREACTQNKKWQEMGLPPITVSVNFSVQQLLHKEIMGTIDRILEQTGNPPQYLEIEITESSFIGNEKEVTELIDKLKARNIKVSLDDFGTGYSSLYLLKRLALDTIKVDKSFVEEVLTDPVNKNIIQCILGLAQSLNMNVVAEGVETAEQYSFLREQKCDEIQGYFFCRPVCSMEIERLLSGRRLNNWELNMRKVM
jgi:diguanylate cyclase (GGDEF)-like protein